MSRFLLLAFAVCLSVVAASDVLVLTPDNFDSNVGGDQPAFVEFFAPWCGHCKSLAPEYEIVASAFTRMPVKVASVDADQYKELGSRFKVTGFPTLKFFPAGSTTPEDYNGGRTAQDIVAFINQKTGLNARVKVAPSDVVVLDDNNFDSIVLDSTKDVLVEFYAPWCGHCKRLTPDYEKVATTFRGESDVVIAKYDADAHKEASKRYEVSGYPTIKFFPKDNKAGEAYEGGRSPSDFVEFINTRSGTNRIVGGGYTKEAGLISELNEFVQDFVATPANRASILSAVKAKVAELSSHKNAAFAKFYVIMMDRIIAKGDSFAAAETARLQRMLDSNTIKADKVAEFSKRRNIASQFTTEA